MKKRILAGALSLVMLFSLMPASVLAAENDVPDSAPASACAQLEDCGGGVHAVDCPLYAAPAGPSEAAENGASEEEGTACGALPGCVGEAHDPGVPAVCGAPGEARGGDRTDGGGNCPGGGERHLCLPDGQ